MSATKPCRLTPAVRLPGPNAARVLSRRSKWVLMTREDEPESREQTCSRGTICSGRSLGADDATSLSTASAAAAPVWCGVGHSSYRLGPGRAVYSVWKHGIHRPPLFQPCDSSIQIRLRSLRVVAWPPEQQQQQPRLQPLQPPGPFRAAITVSSGASTLAMRSWLYVFSDHEPARLA